MTCTSGAHASVTAIVKSGCLAYRRPADGDWCLCSQKTLCPFNICQESDAQSAVIASTSPFVLLGMFDSYVSFAAWQWSPATSPAPAAPTCKARQQGPFRWA